jgi:dTDP-glucose pyrophosphorylase/predicted transcriptional regulator
VYCRRQRALERSVDYRLRPLGRILTRVAALVSRSVNGCLVNSLDQVIVRSEQSIRDVLRRIDRGAAAIALVTTEDGKLAGTVSDGDVRRALIAGAELDDPVAPHMTRDPVCVREGTDRAAVLDLMRARRLNQIPVVDDGGLLVGLHVVQELIGGVSRSNPAVVLAGGRGTRLGQLTAATPKPMLLVAGRPILERIVLHLVGSGVRTIYLAVNYLGDQIREHFGDGSEFGCEITYLDEDLGMPLGTGGPLRRLLEQPDVPAHPVLVMNGDLITSFSVGSILEHHERTNARMTIALSEYAHDVPFGVAELSSNDPDFIQQLAEKPRWTGLVNAGVYVLNPEVLHLVPEGVHFPITDLVTACLERGDKVAGWRLTGDWHDIGRPQEFARARGDL